MKSRVIIQKNTLVLHSEPPIGEPSPLTTTNQKQTTREEPKDVNMVESVTRFVPERRGLTRNGSCIYLCLTDPHTFLLLFLSSHIRAMSSSVSALLMGSHLFSPPSFLSSALHLCLCLPLFHLVCFSPSSCFLLFYLSFFVPNAVAAVCVSPLQSSRMRIHVHLVCVPGQKRHNLWSPRSLPPPPAPHFLSFDL